MTPVLTTFILFGLLLLFLFFNIPLVVAIGLPTLIGIFLSGMDIITVSQKMFSSVNSFTLMAIPFFMLAGKFMEIGGMSRRIVRFANCLVGWMRGGLAHVVVVSSAFFGALSGSAAATCAAIGSTLIPEMKEKGYPADFVSALTSTAGGLGVIIPPSITLIMYGVVSQTSIGKLFIAGIVPGILISVFLMIMVRIQAVKCDIKQTGVFTIKELITSFMDAFPALLVPVIILGGIYGGVFSPTEAGAVAVVYAFIIGVFWYKEVNSKNIVSILGGAISNTVLVLIIVSVSGMFSWLLTINGVANLLSSVIGTVSSNQIVFLILANVIFIFVGAFIESVAGIMIVTPILMPTVHALGIDPVHFGIIMIANLAFGLSTPPVGENQYIASAISGVPFEQQVKASLPFLFANFMAILVITFVPEISLWLPRLIGK